MASNAEKTKHKSDSLISFSGKRIGEITALAMTKFGKCFVKAYVNREDKCFDITVKDAHKTDVEDFETMWPMCRVELLKSIPRNHA